MGRAIMYLDALIATLVHITVSRAGRSEAQAASTCLEMLDEERVISLAMLGDAGDQSLQLARFYDTEGYDVAMGRSMQEEFRLRIHYLLVDGRVTETGYTAHALALLRRQRVFFVKGEPRSLGSPTGAAQQIVTKCSQRLQIWVFLAVHTLRAEFPQWELTQSFIIFDLSQQRVAGATNASLDHCFARIAQAFKLDASELKAQWEDVLPLAHCVHNSSNGCSNDQAWQLAVRRILADARVVRNHPVGTLVQAPTRYMAYNGCTTSGVEQNFSLQQWLITSRRNTISQMNELNQLQLATDQDASPKDKIILGAQRLWCKLYGRARERKVGQRRLDVGMKRRSGRKDQARNEKAWLQHQGDDIAARVAQVARPSVARTLRVSLKRGAEALSDKHVKEAKFMHEKRAKSCIEAARDGILLSKEAPAGCNMPALVNTMNLHEDKLIEQRERDRARRERLLTNRAPTVSFHGASVYIDPAINNSDLATCVATNRMNVETQRMQATMFVVKDVAAPGQRTSLAAALVGGRVAALQYMLSNGRSGASIKYRAATLTKRWVWVSPAFKAAHPALADQVQRAIDMPGSTWQVLGCRADFLSLSKKRPAKKRFEVLGLVASSDRHGGVKQMANAMLCAKFCKFACRIDPADCTLGVCRR
jgi:hypothetical protein